MLAPSSPFTFHRSQPRLVLPPSIVLPVYPSLSVYHVLSTLSFNPWPFLFHHDAQLAARTQRFEALAPREQSLLSVVPLSPFATSSFLMAARRVAKPNPKRAERRPYYHSCSRRRKVCLDPVSLSTPRLVRRGAVCSCGGRLEKVATRRGWSTTSHPAVMLYEFRALYTLISGAGVEVPPRYLLVHLCDPRQRRTITLRVKP